MDILQIIAVLIVIFVFILATEIFFSFCRLYQWMKGKIHGQATDLSTVPPGKYRRTSVSHDWSDASVLLLSEDQIYSKVQQQQQQQQQQEQRQHQPESVTASSHLPFKRRGSHAINSFQDRSGYSEYDSSREDHTDGTSFRSESYSRRFSSSRLSTNEGLRHRRRSHSTGLPNDKVLHACDFVKTMQVEWASGQFVCNHCKLGLADHRYILHEDKSYCKHCYEHLYANICDKCKTPITCEYKDLSCKNRHWHDKCFRCTVCLSSLIDRSFAYKDHHLFCAPCYESRFATKCTQCGNIFRAGMKKFEHRGRQWHFECFCCSTCKKLIGTSSFVPKGSDIICVACYEKQFSQNCSKCQKAIESGGVVYKGTVWHKECFQCSHCNKSLATEKYTSVNQKPLCSQCYCHLYALKCFACKLPISSLDLAGVSTSYISYDERQWHKECFKCVKCSQGLMGRGFMTEDHNIFCPDCCIEDVNQVS